jgi:TPR repeat protein
VRTERHFFGTLTLVLALALGPIALPMPAFSESRGISRTDQLPTEHLRNLRKKMTASGTLPTRELRELADAGDGLAAFKYGKWLEEQGKPQLLPDATHYYAIASYTDRDFAVRRLVALLALPDLELSASRKKAAQDAMMLQASTGNADAALALSNMYSSGQPFGKDPEATLKWLEVAAKGGRGDAAVKLALAYMMPADGSPVDNEKAIAALEIALAQPDPGTKAMAQTLLAKLGVKPPSAPVAVAAEASTDTASVVPASSIRPLPRPKTLGVTQ